MKNAHLSDSNTWLCFSFVNVADEAEVMTQNILACSRAMAAISMSEEELLSTGIVSSCCTAMLYLERILLDLAATPGVTSGIYYHFCLRSKWPSITRVYESGLFCGVMEQAVSSRLGYRYDDTTVQPHPYYIFTDGDILKRTSMVETRAQSIRFHKKKRTSSNEGIIKFSNCQCIDQ